MSVVETHRVEGRDVYVVREDLETPFPDCNNSKMRGARALLERAQADGWPAIGTTNTSISRLGWGVSALCAEMGLTHYDVSYRLKE